MSQPWECPRCGRMNAPFNPACFCAPEKEIVSAGSSQHIMDAANYLGAKGQAPFNPMPLPAGLHYGYKKSIQCLICGGHHGIGVSCMTLKVE